jgi:hypothetical protein
VAKCGGKRIDVRSLIGASDRIGCPSYGLIEIALNTM